ncbi:MFS transporter [Rhodococcus sp. G-MC3]|uniref:MFS transporter n=1 Tax=Rhodococcus sp. G-MC3 TaxID=3046209 RepID=UPI0024B9FF72|nr:MFS transporter [Rhodococcus sp. G-MC3]MDJ0396707.1 MFS transporter [Rhodococcus sp. G-MC3]
MTDTVRPSRSSLPTEVSPGPIRGRQKIILAILLGVQFLIALDFSILNVALPGIGRDVGFTLDNVQWVATSFALTATGLTLFCGRLADRVGRRRLFMAGMLVLAAASILGASASTPTILLTARVLQGLATAMIVPSGLALLTTSFDEGPQRDRALGLNGALLSAGFTAGAVSGGLLTGFLSWRWAFLINVPVCVVALVLTPMFIADRADRRSVAMDLPGAATVTAGLVALVYGITAIGSHGTGDTTGWLCVGAAVVLLAVFVVIEARSRNALVPVRILTRPSALGGNLGGFITFTMFTAQVFLLTIYLQRVLDYSAAQAGLTLAVLGCTAFAAGIFAPRLIALLGNSRRSLTVSLVVQSGATAALYFVGESRSALILILIATAVGGFVHCLAVVSFMVTATSGLDDGEQGMAAGLASMTQQLGITLGIPIMSAVFTAHIHSLGYPAESGAGVLAGTQFTLLCDAAVVLVGAVAVWVILRHVSSTLAKSSAVQTQFDESEATAS